MDHRDDDMVIWLRLPIFGTGVEKVGFCTICPLGFGWCSVLKPALSSHGLIPISRYALSVGNRSGLTAPPLKHAQCWSAEGEECVPSNSR